MKEKPKVASVRPSPLASVLTIIGILIAMFVGVNIYPAMAEVKNISDANNRFVFDLRYGLCVSVFFDIQNLREKIMEELRKTEADLVKTRKDMVDVKELLARIQRAKAYGTEKERMDAINAEPFAEKALRNLRERENKLRSKKVEVEMYLTSLENEEGRLDDLCRKITSMKAGGLLRKCSGSVKVVNANGQESSCSNYSIVEEGSVIQTGSDGKAELFILDGRGSLSLEPNTEVSVLKVTSKQDIIEFVKGKAKFGVEKLEKFRKRIEDQVRSYKEDIRTIQEWYNESVENNEELKIWICKNVHIFGKDECYDKPHINIGVRGTSFTVDRQDNDEVKIEVSEGTVEVEINLPSGKKTVEIKEDSLAVIKPDGTVNFIERR